jgi:hypothetical protein
METPKDFGVLRLSQQPERCYGNEQRMPIKRFKQNWEFPKENALLLNKQLEVMLTCMGTTYSMCCSNNTKISHIVTSISFWTR